MSIWTKLRTAWRGQAHEQVEKQVDNQLFRIFAQEIRDAEAAMLRERERLVLRVAERKQLQKQAQNRQTDMARCEQQGREALSRGLEAEAGCYSERFVTLEREATELQQAIDAALASEAKTVEALRATAAQIRQYQLRLAMAKSSGSHTSTVGKPSGLHACLDELKETEARLQQVQQQQAHLDQARATTDALLDPVGAAEHKVRCHQGAEAAAARLAKWRQSPAADSGQGIG